MAQRKIRIPNPPFLEPREPANTRVTVVAVEGKMLKVIDLPDGTRAVGRADIDRIDLDLAPDGRVLAVTFYADASEERRRGRKPLVEMWPPDGNERPVSSVQSEIME